MLSAALLLFANTLLFSLRLSGGGSFPKPLTAAEEREWLERYARGDPEARNVLIERESAPGGAYYQQGLKQKEEVCRSKTTP